MVPSKASSTWLQTMTVELDQLVRGSESETTWKDGSELETA